MATLTMRLPSGLLSRMGLIEAVRARLAAVENETQRLRTQVRALPSDSLERTGLLRQLERQAAAAAELENLLELSGDKAS